MSGPRRGVADCVALNMFQFEGYTLDIARNSLRAADREVPLRRKSFELLRYLVENLRRRKQNQWVAIGANSQIRLDRPRFGYTSHVSDRAR